MILSLKSVGQVRQDGNSGKISMLILRQKSSPYFTMDTFTSNILGRKKTLKRGQRTHIITRKHRQSKLEEKSLFFRG